MAGEINISGLVGGFDYNSILQQIQILKSQQINMAQAQQQQIQNKKAAVSQINNILKNIYNSINNFTDLNTLNAKGVSVIDSTVVSAAVTDPLKAQAGVYDIQVNQLAQNDVYASANAFSNKDTQLAGLGSGTLTINYKGLNYNVVYDSTYSLQSLADAINRTAQTYNGDFKASVINVGTSSNPQYKLAINSNKTGTENGITITDSNNNSDGLTNVLGGFNHVRTAQNAQITINGISAQSSTNTFDSVLDGVSFTALKVGSTTVEISQDRKPIKDLLTNFVNQYNSLVDKLNTETGKNGNLSGEYGLNRIKNTILEGITDLIVSGVFSFDRTTGKISLNSSKVDEQLNNNYNNFVNKLSTIKNNLGNYLLQTTTVSGTLDNMMKAYDKQISLLQNNIDLMTKRVNDEIQTLKNQFIYMESLQAQYNSISARIQQVFGINTNSNK
ncbi:MAG: flagellar filament capping protein FliD [Hydrogenothermaceae bacterium]|nr:flagellar filament capping protein FliD [Hydrogenothermaceae bacterium]